MDVKQVRDLLNYFGYLTGMEDETRSKFRQVPEEPIRCTTTNGQPLTCSYLLMSFMDID
jgi:hypothetical protein